MILLEAADVPWARLLLLLVPIALTLWCVRRQLVGVERRLLGGVLRATVQLSALGFVLVPLFRMQSDPRVLLVLGLMCSLAAFFSLGLLGKGPGLSLWPQACLAILPVTCGLSLFAVGLMIPGRATLDARYLIPIAGMMAGISMNGVALAGERLLSAMRDRRAELEFGLCLGASGREALLPLCGEAVRTAMTPGMNSLLAVGLVSIPGVLSGQVMAGGDPLVAARYQLMIMILWVSASCLAPTLFLMLVGGRLTEGHRVSQVPPAARRPSFPVPTPEPPPRSAETLAFDARPPLSDEVFRVDEDVVD